MVDVQVKAGPELQATVTALRESSGRISDAQAEALAEGAKPLIAQVKENALRIPATGQWGSTGLRREISEGVQGEGPNRRGDHAEYNITTSMQRSGAGIIPWGMDSPPSDGWMHPVFGNMNVWVQQRGASWFTHHIQQSGSNELEKPMGEMFQNEADYIASHGY